MQAEAWFTNKSSVTLSKCLKIVAHMAEWLTSLVKDLCYVIKLSASQSSSKLTLVYLFQFNNKKFGSFNCIESVRTTKSPAA